MAVSGVGGSSQLFQMLELNKQLNSQAVDRGEQSQRKANSAAKQIINDTISAQQRSVEVGNINLKLGQIVDTTA